MLSSRRNEGRCEMADPWLRTAIAGGGFILVFASGFWLAHIGGPYGIGPVAVHKLLSAGILILLAVGAHTANKTIGLTALAWAAVVGAVAAFVVMIGTGAALTAMNPIPAAVLTAHKTAPYITVLFTLAALAALPHGSTPP